MRGALILAGGKSRRIKRNKALIKLKNKALLLHVIEKVLGLVSEIVVVIGKNDNRRRYASILPLNVTILKDIIHDKGPLAGIFTGMQNMRSKYVVVLPCDLPFIKKEVIKYLFDKAEGADAAIPRWTNMNIEPLHAVYKLSSATPAAETALRMKELFILDMIKRLGKVIYVSIDDIKKIDEKLMTFFNINNQEDLMIAKKLIRTKLTFTE